MKTYSNTNLKELVLNRYEEAKNQGVKKISLDEKAVGDISLYIDTKPLNSIASFIMEEDSVTVYIGTEEPIKEAQK